MKTAPTIGAILLLGANTSVVLAQAATPVPRMVTVFTGPGVSHQEVYMPEPTPIVAGVTPAEVLEVARAFANFNDIVMAEGGDVHVSRQAAYLALGIYPVDPAAFTATVRRLLAEERTFTRRTGAALCARKDEVNTVALYEDSRREARAQLAAWRVGKYRQLQAALTPQDRVPKDLTSTSIQQRGNSADEIDLNLIPSNLVQRMDVIAYSTEIQFQLWRDSKCPTPID